MADDSFPTTLQELGEHGWRLAAASLARAASDTALVMHWFVTPDDADVHSDEHFGSNDRTRTFIRVVVPTLAEQLDASLLTVAVAWEIDDRPALLVLVSAIRGQPAAIEAREITPRPGATLPPFWELATEAATPPPELIEESGAIRW